MENYNRLFPKDLTHLVTRPEIDFKNRTYLYNPAVVAIWGLPGSGKTYLGDALAEVTNGLLFDVDDMRLYGGVPRVTVADKETEQAEMRNAFETQFSIAQGVIIPDGGPVYLSSTGRTERHRRMFYQFEPEIPHFTIVLQAPYEVLRERVLARRDTQSLSNIRSEGDLQSIIESSDPYPEDAFFIDGTVDTDKQISQVLHYLEPVYHSQLRIPQKRQM